MRSTFKVQSAVLSPIRAQATAASQPACPAPTTTLSNVSLKATSYLFYRHKDQVLTWGTLRYENQCFGSVNTASCHLFDDKYQSLAPAWWLFPSRSKPTVGLRQLSKPICSNASGKILARTFAVLPEDAPTESTPR